MAISRTNTTPSYSTDAKVQQTIENDIATLKAELAAGSVKAADVQKLYKDMGSANGGKDIYSTKAANGATYGQVLSDLDISAQGGDLGKVSQDLYALTSQMNQASSTSATIQDQAINTHQLNFDTSMDDRQAFVTAWGNGTTAFAQEMVRNNPTLAPLQGQVLSASNDALWGGTIDPALKNVKGQEGSGGTIGLYAGTDGSLIVANNQARTVQGYTAAGLRQGTNAYDTSSSNSAAQYISSGGATIFWGVTSNNGAWGVRDPKQTPTTPDQLWPASATQGA